MPIRFQVDPDFYDHPKTTGMSDAAFALWVRAGSFSAAKTTDGLITDDVLAHTLRYDTAVADELVRRRLWRRVKGGYRFHEYAERNLTKARIGAERRADRERKQEERRDASVTAREATCHSCGHTYVTRRSDSKFCSPRCRKRAFRGDDRAEAQVETQNVRPDSERIPNGIQTDSGRIPVGSVSVSVSESVSGSGHGAAARNGHGPDTQEPPSKCPEHLDDPDPPKCGRCADARRGHAAWVLEEAERRRTAPRCRIHRGQPAHNCALCRADQLAGETP